MKRKQKIPAIFKAIGVAVLFAFHSLAGAQVLGKNVVWNCQYLMVKDSASFIKMENLQGFAAIKMTDDTTLSVITFCNNGESVLRADSTGQMTISHPTMTKLWCDQKEKEGVFVRSLSRVSSYEMNKDGLKLFIGNKRGYLFFVKNI